jgi:hypothetical protein
VRGVAEILHSERRRGWSKKPFLCTPAMNYRSSRLSVLAPLALFSVALAQVRIVVAHDEWTLSNSGFSATPASTAQFARNVADGFTGGQPGNFRVWSNDFGLTGSQLSPTMTGAGHAWTVATNGTSTSRRSISTTRCSSESALRASTPAR